MFDVKQHGIESTCTDISVTSHLKRAVRAPRHFGGGFGFPAPVHLVPQQFFRHVLAGPWRCLHTWWLQHSTLKAGQWQPPISWFQRLPSCTRTSCRRRRDFAVEIPSLLPLGAVQVSTENKEVRVTTRKSLLLQGSTLYYKEVRVTTMKTVLLQPKSLLLQGSPYYYKEVRISPYYYKEVRVTTRKSVLLQGSPYYYKEVCITTTKSVLLQEVRISPYYYKNVRITTRKSVLLQEDRSTTRKSVLLQGSPYYYKEVRVTTRKSVLLQGSPYHYNEVRTTTRKSVSLQWSPYHYKEVRITRKSVLLQQVCIATRKTVLCYKEDRITTLKSVLLQQVRITTRKSVLLQWNPYYYSITICHNK